MTTLQFADTHNLVAFLSKPTESEVFEQIVNFLNANPIIYVLKINPTIYTSCIEQFWATVKAKTINKEVELQALVDGKKVIITESTVRRDLHLEDAEGVDFLPNATIFAQLTLMGNEFSNTMAYAIICLATNQKFNFLKYIFESMGKNLENVSGKFLMYPRFIQVFLEKQLEGLSNHKRIYVTTSHTKKIFRNMKRVRKGFSRREIPLFPTMVVQAQEEMGEDNVVDKAVNEEMDDSLERADTTWSQAPRHHRDTIAQIGFENVSKTSNDPLLARDCLSSGDYKFKTESQEVREERRIKNSQAQKIIQGGNLQKVSSDDASLGDQEDTSKQERKIDDIDKDAEITLIDET
ncbi:hypothetical protein Tco_0504742 [Tanacetum coccineum]